MFPIFRNTRVRRLDTGGIFSMRTLSVTTDTTNEEVTYNLCPLQFRTLPSEGIILLNIVHSPAAGSEAYPVAIATTPTTTNTPPTSTSRIALINGSGDQMVSSEISQGNRYFIYYNKCDGIFQTLNHIVPPTVATSES
jgi:hypothetical protein|nr:MAG TPA: hypothetical protein [Caudoviricetes sp.]